MTGAFGTTVADYTGTIPGLLERAAERDPGGIWLRTDDLQLTFAETAGRVAGVAAELAEAGIGHGDLVMLTARTTPEYLLSWLALAALGAVTVPVNPASAAAELGGLLRQVRPRAVLTDPGLYPVLDEAAAGDEPPARAVIDVNRLGAGRTGRPLSGLPPAQVRPDDLAVLIPTSGTTGRSKLVMQTHRAYAMAAEGFPFWMELTRQRPADDVAAALSHQRAHLLGARVARLRRRAGARAEVLRERVPGHRAPPRGDRVQRDRGDARDPDAAAGAAG